MENVVLNEKELNALFEKAMQLAEDGFFLARDLKSGEAVEKYRQAFDLVKRLADQLIQMPTPLEPSRSEVVRNAAQLALDCGLIEECRKYANMLIEFNYDQHYLDEARVILKSCEI